MQCEMSNRATIRQRFAVAVVATLAMLAIGCKDRGPKPAPTPATRCDCCKADPCRCAAGCGATTRPTSRPITLGVNGPFCDKTGSQCVSGGHYRSYVGLAKLLSEWAGRPVELNYFPTEPMLIDAARAGQIDGVICKTWPALRAAKAARTTLHRLADVDMPQQPGPVTTQPTTRQLGGILFVLDNSPIRSVKDLDGKRLAVGNEDSYEKSYSVRKLLAEQGAKPTLVVKPTCLSAALAVKEGEVDAAVLSNYAYLYGTLEAVEMPKVRQIGQTELLPFVTIGVFDAVDVATRAKLEKPLVEAAGMGMGDLSWLSRPVLWQPVELKDHE